jgi:hypothetical protein
MSIIKNWRDKNYITDMFGIRQKLLNAPISMRVGPVYRRYTTRLSGRTMSPSRSNYGYRDYLRFEE